ncbi:hypothetical protein ACTFIR_006808 [Dictyostelium discoideum]
MTFLLNFKIKSHDKINEKIQCNKIQQQQQQQQQQQYPTHINIYNTIKNENINNNNNNNIIGNEKRYVTNELSNSKQMNSPLKRSSSKNIVQQKQMKFLEKKNSEELFLIFTIDDL